MHDGAFKAVAMLGADYVRFVPKFPYPRLAVAELEGPTGKPICGTVSNGHDLYLFCHEGSAFSAVTFASYGTPGGQCEAFTVGSCHAANSTEIVEKFCLGLTNCSIGVTTRIFGDPCYGTVKHLSVQAVCTPDVQKTFWNFSLIDPMVEDVMEATQNHSTIINFSTIPQWMWDAPHVPYPDDPNQAVQNYEQGLELRDSSFQQVADYYERLVSWYTKGGFTDEYGVQHTSGYNYNFSMWEVLNEVDEEHSMDPPYYTQVYDAVVTAIQKVQPDTVFVGLALAYSDAAFFQYFLNVSNHASNIPLDWISYHFYAYAVSRTNPGYYDDFFSQADGFFRYVQQIETIRKALNPTVKTAIDELGVILPNDTGSNPLPIPDIYWNACGALFAYEFARLAPVGIEVLGMSQLIGYPTQSPSVSMLTYPDGLPTARYWVLHMLHNNFAVGDKIVSSTSDDYGVAVTAFSTSQGKRILLVNKTLGNKTISIAGITAASLEYVDLTTGTNPPATVRISSPTFTLNPYSVAVLTVL